jgi:hypothetical protein
MISVMVSKWVADALGPDGIYASWIALRRYPWLAPFEFRDNGEIAADAMTPVNSLIVLHDGSPLGELGQYRALIGCSRTKGLTGLLTGRILATWEYHGFPVVQNGILLGYVAREKLKSFIGLHHMPFVLSPISSGLTHMQSLSCPKPAGQTAHAVSVGHTRATRQICRHCWKTPCNYGKMFRWSSS